MPTIVEQWLQQGREEGREEWRKVGREEVKGEVVKNSLAIGLPLETIAKITGYTIDKIKQLTTQFNAEKATAK